MLLAQVTIKDGAQFSHSQPHQLWEIRQLQQSQSVQTLISKEDPILPESEPTSPPSEVPTELQQTLLVSGNLLTIICRLTLLVQIQQEFCTLRPTDLLAHQSSSPSMLTKNIHGKQALDTTLEAPQQPLTPFFSVTHK